MHNNSPVIGGGPSGNTAASTGVSAPSSSSRSTVDLRSRLRRSRQNAVNVAAVEAEEVDVVDVVVDEVDVDEEVDDDDDEEEAAVAYLDAEVEDANILLSGSDGAGSDVDNSHHHPHHRHQRQRPPRSQEPGPAGSSSGQAATADATPMEVDDEAEADGPQNISDYILNVAKFMERMHAFLNLNDSSPHPLHTRTGVQLICDILSMPGLPFDFPVSFSCSTLCKSFEQILNFVATADVLHPLLEALGRSMDRAKALREGLTANQEQHQSTAKSRLLAEFRVGRTELLHELVTIASILCVLVQVINHLKPEGRNVFGNLWSERDYLRDLG